MHKNFKDRTGKTFGRITAHWPVGRNPGDGSVVWLCSCTCGTLVTRYAFLSISCGCLTKERLVTHGLTVGYQDNPVYRMYCSAKSRAKKQNLAFSIDISDITVPGRCPLLGTPMVNGSKKRVRNSPSLDRIIPSLGYIKGNVWVISYRANAIKQDASLEELEKLTKNLRNAIEHGAIKFT